MDPLKVSMDQRVEYARTYRARREELGKALLPGFDDAALSAALGEMFPQMERGARDAVCQALAAGCDEGTAAMRETLETANDPAAMRRLVLQEMEQLTEAAGVSDEYGKKGLAIEAIRVLYRGSTGEELGDNGLRELAGLDQEALLDRLAALAETQARAAADDMILGGPGLSAIAGGPPEDSGAFSPRERALLDAAARFAAGADLTGERRAAKTARLFGQIAGAGRAVTERIILCAKEADRTETKSEYRQMLSHLGEFLAVGALYAAGCAVCVFLTLGYVEAGMALMWAAEPAITAALGESMFQLIGPLICMFWGAIPVLAAALVDLGVESLREHLASDRQLSDDTVRSHEETGDEGEEDDENEYTGVDPVLD